MKQKWKKTQFVEISIDEIFCFQDKLDAAKNDPEKVWDIVDDFFAECENQLEMDPGFLREVAKLKRDDFIPLNMEYEVDLFNNEE